MNREIKEVVKLLAEIDKICKREGIPYYLGPQLTLCCVTGQEITSPHAGVVYMRTADMERFRLAVEKETPDGRIVESMNNNKHFYGFFLRYTDLDTLCFRLNEGRNYKYPGMGVDILPLRGKQRSDLLICGQEPRKWDGMSWLIIMETEKAGKRQSAVLP